MKKKDQLEGFLERENNQVINFIIFIDNIAYQDFLDI